MHPLISLIPRFPQARLFRTLPEVIASLRHFLSSRSDSRPRSLPALFAIALCLLFLSILPAPAAVSSLSAKQAKDFAMAPLLNRELGFGGMVSLYEASQVANFHTSNALLLIERVDPSLLQEEDILVIHDDGGRLAMATLVKTKGIKLTVKPWGGGTRKDISEDSIFARFLGCVIYDPKK